MIAIVLMALLVVLWVVRQARRLARGPEQPRMGSVPQQGVARNINPRIAEIEASPEYKRRHREYRESIHRAEALLAAGRPSEAATTLEAAFRSPPLWQPPDRWLLADAYVMLHRDSDALALLGPPYPTSGREGARAGLLLARLGRLEESRALDPGRAISSSFHWQGPGPLAPRPPINDSDGLIAAWCLAIGADAFTCRRDVVAEYYYRLGLAAKPGQPLLSHLYGFYLCWHRRYEESLPHLNAAIAGLTGSLRHSAEVDLAEAKRHLHGAGRQ